MRQRLPLLLAALPLTLWLLLAAVALGRMHATPPTGDALVDDVVQRIEGPQWQTPLRWKLQELRRGLGLQFMYGVRLAPRDVLDLETRFADDPRTWLLLYTTGAPLTPTQKEAMSGRSEPGQVLFLEEARRRQVLNAPLLYALEDIEDDQAFGITWEALREDHTLVNATRRLPHNALTLGQMQQIRAAVARVHWAPTNSLLQQLVALAPHDGLPLFLQAQLAAENGDLHQSFQLLAQDNAQPDFSSANFGILPERLTAPQDGKASRATRLVQGWSTIAIRNQVDADAVLLFPGLCDGLSDDCLVRHDLADFDTLFHTVCRFGEQPDLQFDDSPAEILASLQAKIDSDAGMVLDARQAAAWQAFKDKLQELNAVRQQTATAGYARPWAKTRMSDIAALLTGGQSAALEGSEWRYSQSQFERTAWLKLQPLWEELAQFDMEHFAWTGTSAAAAPSSPLLPPAGGS